MRCRGRGLDRLSRLMAVSRCCRWCASLRGGTQNWITDGPRPGLYAGIHGLASIRQINDSPSRCLRASGRSNDCQVNAGAGRVVAMTLDLSSRHEVVGDLIALPKSRNEWPRSKLTEDQVHS